MLTVLSALFRKSSKVPAFTPEYDVSWVRKLRDGIARHYHGPWRMVCLTDGDHELEGVEFVPLLRSDEGWMNLQEVYRPDLGVERGLFLGLDTIICGSITALVDDAGTISAPRNWHRDHRHEPSNACVVFNEDEGRRLWDAWDADRERWRRECRIKERNEGPSEMRFLVEMVRDHPAFSYLADGTGEVVSYREEVLRSPALRQTARVVYFHGSSKPTGMRDGDPLWRDWR